MKPKPIILSLFLAVIFSGCHTRYVIKHKAEICNEICPEKVILINDTVETINFDTIWINNGIDSLLFNAVLSGNKKPDTIFINDNSWQVRFIINEKLLNAKITHLSDSLMYLREKKQKVITKIDKQVIKIPNPEDEVLKRKAQNRGWIIVSILALIVLFYAGRYFIRKYLHIKT